MDSKSFVQTCADLAPVLAQHAEEGEQLRSVPDEVMTRMHQSGVMHAVVPKSLGGHGLGLETFCEGVRELAHGCPATAWTSSFLMLHAWMVTKFPAESHDELFSGGKLPTAAAPLTPSGQLVGAPGGYRVSGRWEWATGIMHSDWCMVHGFDQTVEFGTRFALVPVSQLKIEDTWQTSGMRATGSNTVVVDDVFVPMSYTCEGSQLREKASAVPDDVLGALPLLPTLAFVASAPAVGAAEAALDLYTDRVKERILAYSLGDKALDQPVVQSRLAALSSDVTGMTAAWRVAMTRLAAEEGVPSELLRVQSRLAAAAAVRQCRLTIGEIGVGAGASLYASSHPLQRLQRDVETLKGHVVFDWDRATELAGRVMLGFPLGPTDMA